MSLPEEEKQRLAEMFGDFSFLDARLVTLDPDARYSDWYTEDNGVDPNINCHRFEFVSGKVSVRLNVFKDWAFLDCRSDLPDFLKWVKNMDDYLQFIDFVLEDFPSMLYLFKDKNQTRDLYTPESHVDLKYRGGNVASAGKVYKFDTQKDRIALISEFVTKPNAIESLSVMGNTATAENNYPYNLTLWYPKDKSFDPIVYIGIPINERTISGWNSDVLRWALGTHADRDGIEDMGVSADNLRSQILPIIQSAIQDKIPQP